MKTTGTRTETLREERVSGEVNADFEQSVRDALRHLHDQVYLRTHPLTRLVTEPGITSSVRGKRLHQLLLQAIASIQLTCEPYDSRAARRHELLTLRYVEALEIGDVAARIGISRREYTRLHREALDGVISALEDYTPPSLSPPTTLPPGSHASPRNRLPVPLSTFIGREKEITEVRRLMESVRLVTLTGPPGTGKTRLALQMAADLSASLTGKASFPNGVYFVPLASIPDPGLVLSAIAQIVSPGSVSGHSPIDSLVDRLSQHHGLLVLDNFEHVISAAQVVSHLLISCPHLTVLVTSREALRLSGEYEYVVPPLRIPHGNGPVRLEEMAACEAVRLYVERASAMKSGFLLTEQNARAVVELCRRLDGLPLAIELAAARSKVFPPYALLARLGDSRRSASGTTMKVLSGGGRDMPDRQQTLRSAINWSYRLLTPEEQRLFAHLSVFAGGWTLEAAEGVCCPGENTEVVDVLASLVDKSLVQQAETPDGRARFNMLEVIREYARDRFEALTEEVMEVCRRHAEYFLHLAREADAHYWGPEQSLWQRRLVTDLDNLRAALAWARDSNDVDQVLQLASTLRHFWFDSGRRREGRTWIEDALRRAGPTHRTVDRAAALLSAGECNWLLNDLPGGRLQFEESLGIYRELGDGRGTGWALHGLAVIVGQLGDLTTARSLCEEALLLSRAAGDRPAVALELHGLGLLAMRQGDAQTARSRVEESQHIWQELGDTEHLCLVSNILGDLARLRGRYSEAVGHYRECLELIGEQGPQGWRALYLRNLGLATYRGGEEQLARQLLVEALVRFQELGDRRGVAECVAGLACLAAETEPERMARLFGAATAAVEAVGPQLNPSDQAEYDYSLAIARRQLDNKAFDAAWTHGRTLTLEQAVTEALELWGRRACPGMSAGESDAIRG